MYSLSTFDAKQLIIVTIRNDIIDLDQIENLSLCSNLHELTLEGNAIDFGNAIKNCDDLDELQVEARVVISKILPNLRILDDVPLKPDTHEDASTTKSNRF